MLAVGTQLGLYKILASLGAGGMGQVYLAEDTRLGRKIALKLLPAEFTKDAGRVRRFEQEAKAVSALNHPHIITIHEIGEAEAGRFIVMELVRGRTLRELIGKPCSPDTLAGLGEQIAKALVVTHAADVTHRDIKPENIMVRDDGYVKVLDFGLARLIPAGFGAETDTRTGTTPGLLVGTVRYMSPEQARGEIIGSATDIFSLGIVFYELAAGRHPFAADSMPGVLHAITAQRPLPLSRLHPGIPTALDTLILRMLEKDPRLRPPASEVETSLLEIRRAGERESARQLQSAPASPTLRLSRPPARSMVGRERERAELHAGLARASAGHGLLLCVAGEPGIGKTTLVEDFLAEVSAGDQPCLIARGRCSERLAGAEAYLPLLEALDSLLLGPGSDFAARAMKLLAPTWYLQVAPLSAENSSSTLALTEAKAVSQERMKRELGAFFQEVSQLQPLVLFFDDLHWADLSTIDLLAYLASRFETLRLLMVATYRPSDLWLSKHPFLHIKPDLQARGACRETTLEFLGRAEIEAYLRIEFPGHRFPAELPALIHAKTEGNPLFMTDLVRYLRDRRVIVEDQQRWTLAGSLPDIERELPESVRGMIERKIAQLSEDDRRLLVAASVQGYEFDSAVVAKALSADPAEVEERLEVLERVYSFVRLVDEREFPDRTLTSRYRFVHALYQNALYTALRPTRRVQLSAAVANGLQGYYGEQSDTVAAELAHLYASAREFARAAEFYLVAAQSAGRVFANAEATMLCRRGLEALQSLPEGDERARSELKLQITLGFSLMLINGYGATEVKQTYERALQLCQQLHDEKQLFQVQFGLSIVHVVRAEYEEGLAQAQQSLRLAQRAQAPMLLAQAHWAVALSVQHLGELTSACEHFAKSIELYPSQRQGPALLYGAILNRAHLARLRLYLGYSDQARELIQEAVAAAQKVRHPIGPANTFSIAAFMDVFRRRPPDVQGWADALTKCAEEHGLPYYAAIGAIMRGWALVMLGESDGIALMREGLAACQATGTAQHRASYLVLLADALGAAGRIAEGLEALQEALAAVQRTKEHFYEAELYRITGELILKESGVELGAEAHFRQSIEIARRQGAKSFELRAVMSLGRLWRQQGRRAEARQMLAEIHGWFSEGFDTLDLREARVLLDELT